MNKKNIIISILVVAIIGLGIFFYVKYTLPHSNYNHYEANKTSIDKSEISQDSSNSSPNKEIRQGITESQQNNFPKVEEQIASFSTKIYSNDSSRQNNINLTCNTLNETIVKNGDTFSFCNTIGQSTSDKGYQKADVFDRYGNKKKGLGGGNCQISTTLYNAVLSVPSLVVLERHPHSNYVPYIEKGKDAAVAYGSYDFKFRNDSGNDIKILAATDGSSVTTSLVSLK